MAAETLGTDAYLSRVQEAQNRMLRGMMDMAVMPPVANAAQGSLFGQVANTGSSMFGNPIGAQTGRSETMFDHNRQVQITVTNADNGFILSIRPEMMGTASRILVANTIEELRDLITSEMVTRQMEK